MVKHILTQATHNPYHIIAVENTGASVICAKYNRNIILDADRCFWHKIILFNNIQHSLPHCVSTPGGR